MKINELLEARITDLSKENVDPNNILQLLQEYCSDALETMGKNPMARYSRHGYGIASIVDPTVGERKSQNTSNHYTLIMDHSPYMKGFPRRSKSIICHSVYPPYYRNAPADRMYILYPFDGTIIGVCPDEDLWDTKVTIPGLGLTEKTWEKINHVLKDSLGVPDSSYDALYSYMKSDAIVEPYKKLTDYLNTVKGRSYPITLDGFKPLEDPKMLLEHVQYCMRPDANGLQAVAIEDWKPGPKRECWIGGKFLAIDARYFFNELIRKNILDRIL